METQKKGSKKGVSVKKIIDVGSVNSSGSRLNKYWSRRGFDTMFRAFRLPAIDITQVIDVANPETAILQKFNIRGLEFGNWVTNEDRFNYIGSLVLALYDLNKILRFNYNIGLDKHLTIAFGSRGRGKALAHYEPWSEVINLTRYEKGTVAQNKKSHFLNSGGVGSLAHEYGHFLDYFFGSLVEPSRDYKSLTFGHETGVGQWQNLPRNSCRALMQNVVRAIIFKKPGFKSDYYRTLEKEFLDDDYWFRHNELFSRAFEQYVSFKLQKQGIKSRFLAQSKYAPGAYMKEGDLLRVMPYIEKLISRMSALVRA